MNEAISAILTAVIGAALDVVLLTWPVMIAWNYAMPSIFDLPRIGFWQAFALLVVAHSLLRTTATVTKD